MHRSGMRTAVNQEHQTYEERWICHKCIELVKTLICLLFFFLACFESYLLGNMLLALRFLVCRIDIILLFNLKLPRRSFLDEQMTTWPVTKRFLQYGCQKRTLVIRRFLVLHGVNVGSCFILPLWVFALMFWIVDLIHLSNLLHGLLATSRNDSVSKHKMTFQKIVLRSIGPRYTLLLHLGLIRRASRHQDCGSRMQLCFKTLDAISMQHVCSAVNYGDPLNNR